MPNHGDKQEAKPEDNHQAKQVAIESAIGKFSKPEVYYQVLLASSPDVAMDIVETLPGVRDLIEIGPDAASSVLGLLRPDGTVPGDNLSTIALYLLHFISTPETTRALAEAVSTDQFTGLNSNLAARAFLRSTGHEVIEANETRVVEIAKERARNYPG